MPDGEPQDVRQIPKFSDTKFIAPKSGRVSMEGTLKVKNFILTLACLCLLVGCSSSDEPKKEDEKKTSQTQFEHQQPITVGTTNQPGEMSPAQTTGNVLADDALPEDVCRILHKAISDSDRLTWQRCLSRISARNVHTANFQLALPGSEQATYSVVSTSFATSKQKIAMVQCVVEDIFEGERATSTFSWLMRKGPAGWRVTGMSIPTDSPKKYDLISFENSQDIAQMKSWAGAGEAVAENHSDSSFK